MRYFIKQGQAPPLLSQLGENVLYARSEEGRVIVVSREAGNQVCLRAWEGVSKEPMVSNSLSVVKGVDWERVCRVWCCDDEWVILQSNPVQLFLVVRRYSKMFEVKLEEEIEMDQVLPFLTYPDLIIYGRDQKTSICRLISLHLHTFQVKPLQTPNINHSPLRQMKYWAHASQQRFYVAPTSAELKGDNEALFWTYNIENGNWFALALSPPGLSLPANYLNCQVQNGKVLVCSQSGLLLVELYQSRVNYIQNQQQVLWGGVLRKIRFMVSVDGYVCLLFEDGKRACVELGKQKVSK